MLNTHSTEVYGCGAALAQRADRAPAVALAGFAYHYLEAGRRWLAIAGSACDWCRS
jgi:hypothetical protein